MKNRISAVLLVISLLITTTLTARLYNCGLCMRTQSIVQVMTTSTVTATVHNHTPNNHNLQEMAVALEKTHEFVNSADYMEGLTASSKRSIYVGDAERRFCVRINR